MIRASNELRDVSVGATVNLFVAVGRTSRRLKGTVEATRERGANGEVLEVSLAEATPGNAEILFRLGFTAEETYLLPLAVDGDDVVYARYRREGGRTDVYVDEVRAAEVRSPTESVGGRSTPSPRVEGSEVSRSAAANESERNSAR